MLAPASESVAAFRVVVASTVGISGVGTGEGTRGATGCARRPSATFPSDVRASSTATGIANAEAAIVGAYAVAVLVSKEETCRRASTRVTGPNTHPWYSDRAPGVGRSAHTEGHGRVAAVRVTGKGGLAVASLLA